MPAGKPSGANKRQNRTGLILSVTAARQGWQAFRFRYEEGEKTSPLTG